MVVIPATTLLTPDELRDRLDRGRAKAVVGGQDQVAKFASLGVNNIARVVGATSSHEGWLPFEQAAEASDKFTPDGPTKAEDTMLLYFTSGTHTAKPKLVRHSQRSYPVGGLSTMYWLGLQPGDVHLNISSPGWAKHAWSCFFAPWNGPGATVFVVGRSRVSTPRDCSPPSAAAASPRCARRRPCGGFHPGEAFELQGFPARGVRAGEQLNPEVIDQGNRGDDHPRRLRPDRDHGLAGNSPGQKVKIGSMGRPLPGYRVRITDGDGHAPRRARSAGARCRPPAGLMQGYQGDGGELSGANGDLYRTGDVVFADDEGYLTFVGRSDHVSNRRTIASARSNWRASCWSMKRSRKQPSCLARIRSASRFQKPMYCWWPMSRGRRRPRCRSSSICIPGFRRSSAFAGSNW